MTFRNFVLVAMIAASGLALTGCETTTTSTGTCNGGGSCGAGGGIGWLNGTQARILSSVPIDAAGVVLDTSGSTIAYPSTGTVTLSLFNASGAVVASKSFPWVRSGAGLIFSSPAAVNQWESANNNGVSQINYQLAPFTAGFLAGTNTMSIATTYQGVTLSHFSSTFKSARGSQCPSCKIQ